MASKTEAARVAVPPYISAPCGALLTLRGFRSPPEADLQAGSAGRVPSAARSRRSDQMIAGTGESILGSHAEDPSSHDLGLDHVRALSDPLPGIGHLVDSHVGSGTGGFERLAHLPAARRKLDASGRLAGRACPVLGSLDFRPSRPGVCGWRLAEYRRRGNGPRVFDLLCPLVGVTLEIGRYRGVLTRGRGTSSSFRRMRCVRATVTRERGIGNACACARRTGLTALSQAGKGPPRATRLGAGPGSGSDHAAEGRDRSL